MCVCQIGVHAMHLHLCVHTCARLATLAADVWSYMCGFLSAHMMKLPGKVFDGDTTGELVLDQCSVQVNVTSGAEVCVHVYYTCIF
jgi:hypothetical protein